MTHTETPYTMALKFRIWAYAAPKGWSVTVSEVADEFGVTRQHVINLARQAGWSQRFRVESTYKARAVNPMIAAYMAADIVAGRIGYAG